VVVAGKVGTAEAVVGKAIGFANQLRQCAGPACVGLGSEIEEQIELPAAGSHSRIEIAIVLAGVGAAGGLPVVGGEQFF